ncbi:glycine cleavage system protein R [Candidatus Marithrix sp. Canyon 246]|uniref:glycine cleavage system protein R n=1 Tax=Candidatus Marithrix sp. Canyon 246 TaxID=1827136 RepID=UPI00084A1CA0|nr:ACT domain-containing protein [Candidatus Marithrix sp. Canyon 246]
MSQWFMITLVGKDQIGIVAKITTSLYECGCNLGEASMLRLGGNFTIMLMVAYDGTDQSLHNLLKPVADKLELHLHINSIEGQLHQHQIPNVRVKVYGSDRIGILAQVTTALAKAGFNILDLESDVGGDNAKPFYIINIEGFATAGIETVETVLEELSSQQHDLEVKIEAIETVVM